MNVGKDFFCWAEAGGRRTKNEPISEEEHLVNPSIPKMEVLDACFKNSIKENVFQLYIFKKLPGTRKKKEKKKIYQGRD